MYRLFIDDGADAALKPEIFLRPAFARIRAARLAALPRARRARRAAVPARPVPTRRDGVVRDARARGAHRACSTTAPSTPSCRGSSRRPGAPTIFASCERKLFLVATNLDTGASVTFGAPGHDHVPISRAIEASSALPGLVPAGRDRRRALRRRRAQQDAARVGRARRRRRPAAVRQSARAVRRERRAARRPRSRVAKLEPGRPAARAVADVPRDHPFADEGRHGEVPPPVSARRHRCCSSRSARTPTCSSRSIFSYAQRKRLCALAFDADAREPRARAQRRWRRSSRRHGIALRTRAPRRRRARRRPTRSTDPRPLHIERASDAGPCAQRRASSRTRSITSSASSPHARALNASRLRRTPSRDRARAHCVRCRESRRAARASASSRRPRALQSRRRAARHDGRHRRRDEHQPGQSLLSLPQQGRDHRRAVRRATRRRRAALRRPAGRARRRRGPVVVAAPAVRADVANTASSIATSTRSRRATASSRCASPRCAARRSHRDRVVPRTGRRGNDARVASARSRRSRATSCWSRPTGCRSSGIARRRATADGDPTTPQLERAAYQVLALIAPYLVGDDRALIERLGARLLG